MLFFLGGEGCERSNHPRGFDRLKVSVQLTSEKVAKMPTMIEGYVLVFSFFLSFLLLMSTKISRFLFVMAEPRQSMSWLSRGGERSVE